MQIPTIIIAEKNRMRRTRLARALTEKFRAVETTGSAACLMESLLHRGLSVVVLGDGLEEGLSVASLVTLLKRCSPHSSIILITDEVTPTEELNVCQQGIFYRANRPVCASGWEELQRAVACACNSVMLAAMPSRASCNLSRV